MSRRTRSVTSTAASRRRDVAKPEIIRLARRFLQTELPLCVRPCRQMSSQHIQIVPSNVRVFENRRASQNRWVFGVPHALMS